jgi:hypothetical protein
LGKEGKEGRRLRETGDGMMMTMMTQGEEDGVEDGCRGCYSTNGA